MHAKELKNKEVTVMGLGRLGGGVEVAKFLAKHGARVLVTDIKKSQDLEDAVALLKGVSGLEFVLGHHRKEDFIDKDFIVKNPGIPVNSPYLQLAKDHKVPIETDISLFFKLSPARVIGVTGTKGKSTTATLIYELLKTRYATFLAGNIGLTPLKIIDSVDANSLVVLELSSWQLEDLAPFQIAPHVSVITNIYEDHLDRHGDFAHYRDAKKNIITYGQADHIAILNEDEPVTRQLSEEARGKVYFFSDGQAVNGAFFHDGNLYFDESGEAIMQQGEIALNGVHNLSNIAAAVTVAKIYKIKNTKIVNVLRTFKGIPFRQELVRERDGVQFINDTTATNPAAAIASLQRFGPRCVLIAGGMDKQLDYSLLAKAIMRYARFAILLPGSASEKLKHSFEKQSFNRFREVESLTQAIKTAFIFARKGDAVVFSPGAASFNMFKNEFDRGVQFNEIVNSL